MKKIIFVFWGMVFYVSVFSQNAMDVILLKNGNIVKGVVIEQVLGESLKLQTNDGNVFAYKMDEVAKITKEIGNDENAMVGMNMNQLPKQLIVLKRRPYFFEIIGAYSFSWLAGFNDATGLDGSLKSSYQAGLGFTFAINSKIGLETGATYLVFGGNEYSKIDSYGSINGKIELSYVQIPILVRFDFMNDMNVPKGTSVGVKSGLQLGLNTGATNDWNTMDYSSLSTTYYSKKFDVNKNIDWVFGIYGYTGHSGVSMNYNHGLNDVVKTSDNGKNFKNRNITFSYSYRF